MPLSACSVAMDDPRAACARLQPILADHGELTAHEDGFDLTAQQARLTLRVAARRLELELRADDDVALSAAQLALSALFDELGWSARWPSGLEAGAPPPLWSVAKVVAARSLSPSMRRLRLSGARLARFAEGPLHARLFLPDDPAAPPPAPVLDQAGKLCWPEGVSRPISRVYTIRRIGSEGGWVEIDCVLHGSAKRCGGACPGATWAGAAAPGDWVGLSGPGGGGAPEAAALILHGDETAMPAIARILESAPPETAARARIFIETARAAEEAAYDGPGAPVFLRHGEGEAALGAALRADPGALVWSGCEAETAAALRRLCRDEFELPRKQVRISAYWRRGAAQTG